MTDISPKGRKLINALGIPGILLMIWLGGFYFSIFITVVVVLALKEFYSLYRSKGIYASLTMGLVGSVFFVWFYHFEPYLNMLEVIQLVIVFVLLLLIFELFSNKINPVSNLAYTIFGIAYIPMLLGTLIALRQIDMTYGTYYTIAIIVSVWICDSAAFGFGVKWGKKKIFPRTSPNKSIVGSVAGFISVLAFFIILAYFEIPSLVLTMQDVIIFSIISGVFGQLGDFVESLFKRDAGVKDSGTFLLGHGGVLDRFDSLIFAAPLTYFYLHF